WRNTGAPVYEGLGEGEWKIFVDGVEYGNYNLVYDDNMTSINLESGASPFGHITYWDAIGFDWDPNYAIGDNFYEGLLLSFENSTVFDWTGYSLDYQPTKTIRGNTTFLMPKNGLHSIQVFGNDSFGTIYNSETRFFTIDYQPLKIITPENKTYTEPMNGYYPATYGFENDPIGRTPIDWVNITTGNQSSYTNVISDYGGHKDVIDCFHAKDSVWHLRNFFNNTEGTIEFWIRHSSYGSEEIVEFTMSNSTYSTFFDFYLFNGDIRIYTDIGQITIGNYLINTWHHIRIDFRGNSGSPYLGLNQNEFNFHLDDILLGTHGFQQPGDPYFLQFESFYSSFEYYTYLDAIGYSWDPNYNVGDNMYEGLLLSFENKTTFDWVGYSLDGQANKTILGNTTISMPSEGVHSIQLFANDSMGTVYQSELRYFTFNTSIPIIDSLNPDIFINTPTNNELFGSIPPSYNLTVVELNLDTMWYTLDEGFTNTTITEPTGMIDQVVWDTRPNGTVTITFYAEDIAGNIGFEDVDVRKDILPPTVVINSPIQNQVFRDNPPSFDLTITDGNLDSIWYTLDDGIVNVPCEIAGSIHPAYWGAIPPGDYTLKFYANDTLGNVGSSEVIVKKREPLIPGYNPIILFPIFFGVIICLKRLMKKKLIKC
ncbi:MAG: hypothetical protein ACXAC7_23565, partial [Candidatus Hodarchaeales archaeon]